MRAASLAFGILQPNSARKQADVYITADTKVPGYGTFSAGTYRVAMPVTYDPRRITARDLVHDGELRVIGRGRLDRGSAGAARATAGFGFWPFSTTAQPLFSQPSEADQLRQELAELSKEWPYARGAEFDKISDRLTVIRARLRRIGRGLDGAANLGGARFPSGGLIIGKPGTPAFYDGLHGLFPVKVLAVRTVRNRDFDRDEVEVQISGKSGYADYSGWWPARRVIPKKAVYGQYRNKIAPYRWEPK